MTSRRRRAWRGRRRGRGRDAGCTALCRWHSDRGDGTSPWPRPWWRSSARLVTASADIRSSTCLTARGWRTSPNRGTAVSRPRPPPRRRSPSRRKWMFQLVPRSRRSQTTWPRRRLRCCHLQQQLPTVCRRCALLTARYPRPVLATRPQLPDQDQHHDHDWN